jgi:hypothetical protein
MMSEADRVTSIRQASGWVRGGLCLERASGPPTHQDGQEPWLSLGRSAGLPEKSWPVTRTGGSGVGLGQSGAAQLVV